MKKIILLLISLFLIFTLQKTNGQDSAAGDLQAKKDSLGKSLSKAQLYIAQGKTAEASKIYTSLMAAYPDNREAVQSWLSVNRKKGPTGGDEAIKSLEELEKSYPANRAILFFKSSLQVENGHNEDAIKTFDRLLSFDPKNEEIPGMKASAIARTGKFNEALELMKKTMDLAPGKAINYYSLACIYNIRGSKSKAILYLEKAVSMNPALRESARKERDFKNLLEDPDFKRLTK